MINGEVTTPTGPTVETELQDLIRKLDSEGKSREYIKGEVMRYRAQKAQEAKKAKAATTEPTPSTLGLDQQEVEENVDIPKESSIDQDWWDNAGLDRGSYFDEQGNMLPEPWSLTAVDPGWDQIRLEEENAIKTQAALESAESYDSADISEGEGDREYATQSVVEANLATEKQKKENIEKASTDYQEFIDTSFAYNSITDEDKTREAALMSKWGSDALAMMRGEIPTIKYFGLGSGNMLSVDNYVAYKSRRARNPESMDFDPTLPSYIEAKHNGYESNPMFRDTKIDIAKSEYAKKAKLSPSETKKLLNANVDPAHPESMEPFSTFDEKGNVISFEDEYNNIDPNQAGRVLADGTKLGDTLRKGVEDRLTAQNDVESVRVNVKNFVEALPSYSETSVLGAAVKGSTGLDLGLFLKGDTQKLIEKRAKEDFKLLESSVQKIASEASVIGSQIKNNGALLTKAHEDLKSLGDVRSEIDKLKNGEYTTEAQVKSANQKISALVNDYTAKFNAFDKYRKAHSTLNNAAARIGGEIKDLDVKVSDLGAFTEFVGDNYAIGTQMAWSAANAAIDLGQGFADFAYMVNPFGAMSDELIDWAGEDSLTASIVEGFRIAASPMTAGLSLYSGDRRDTVRDAIDGFQENVSSKIEQPPAFSSIKDAGSFAEWAAVTGIAQAPQLALMYATGGTAGLILMGAGAAGTKYNEMEENRETYKESGGLYGIDHSFASMFAVSTFTGVIESLSEKVTLGQLNAAGRVMKNEVFKASGRRGIANYLRNDVFTKDAFRSTLRGGKDLFEEGGSEFLATVGGNALTIASGDKSVGLWDGGLESFVTGAMISSTIKTPSLFRAAVAPFQSKTTSQILNNNLDIIERHRDIASGEIEASKEAKQFAEDIIDEAVHENKLALELDIKRVDVYEDAEKSRLIEIESDNIDLRRKATAIAQDETLDKSQKKEMINDLQTKLNNNLDEKQGIIDKYPEDVVNKKYSETSLSRQPAAKTFEENIEFAKKHSALYGLEVDDTMSPAEIRDYLLAQGESQEDADSGMEADGFILGNKIIINREIAMAKDAVTVGSHELLHGILRKAMGEGAISTQVISQLKRSIGSQWSVVQERIDANYTPEYMARNPDEYLTLVSDAIAKGEITYQETVFDKLRDSLNEIPIFKKYFPNIKFKTGRDVYRFLREYNKSIHKGALATDIIKATQQADKDSFKEIQKRGRAQEAAAKKDDLKPSMTSGQKKAAAKNVKELGVKETNKSWRRGGADAAIKNIKDNGYFDALIASKYKVKPVPRDFVEKVYSEITPHIKRFKPEQNDDLFAYINSQIGNKAGNVYNSEYKVDEAMRGSKDIDAKTSEGAPVIQVEAETDAGVQAFEEQDMSMAAQAKRTKLAEQGKSESDRYSGLRTELGLEKPMMDKVRKAVMKTFGTKLPDVNSKKFKAALQKAYRTELKKPIQDMIGKGEVYDTFLAESFPTVFKFLPKETLLQMERNVAPENRIFTKSERITKPTEVDKLISDGLLPKETNRLSGPTLITKLPYPGSKKVMAYFRGQNMDNALGYKVGASTLGTRKDKLAMEMGVELGFDATMETVQDPEVTARREGILELTGQVQAENDISVMGKQIDRDPGIKFSKSSLFEAQAMSLVKDVVNSGFETVFTEDGKLVEGYPAFGYSQKAIDFAYNLWDDGTLNDGKSIGFKAKVFLSDKFPQEVKDAFKEDGALKNNDDALDRLYDAVSVLTTELGPGVMDAIGFEIAGFKNRVMDAPKLKKDGTPGRFYERLQKLSKKVRDSVGVVLPFGLDLKAVSIMNKNAGVNSIFGKVQKILDMPIKAKGEGGKLEMLAKLQPEIDAASAANIKLAKHISAVLIKGVRDGSIDQVSALHLLQAQTGIVNGFRGLSRLDLITVLDGSQKPGENHPHYKRVYKELSKTMPKDKARIEAIKRTGSKGEHLAPNSNTMFEIAELFNEKLTDVELNNRLDDIFRGHSQMHTTIGLTKTMDKELGATNDTDFNRVKALDQVDIDATVRADGTPYPIVLAEVEILKEVSKMNSAVDQRNESTKVMDQALKASRSGTKKLIDGLVGNDVADTLADAVSGVNPDGYSNVRFSKSHRAEYEKRLLKNRAGLNTSGNKKVAEKLVDDLFKWLDSPSFYLGTSSPIYAAKHKSKFEKLALHYMVHNKLILPEDGFKVIEAERLARVKKLDPFSFKNPNEIIERYSEEVDGKKTTNPDDVEAFTNKRELANGITIYDVNFAENFDGAVAAERQAVRDQVDQHFGKKSNPWCIVQSADGKLTEQAEEYWDQYGTKQIIFKDGKLLAMRTESREDGFSDEGDVEFWSRDNVKYNEIPGNDYVDEQGRMVRSSFDEKTGEKTGILYGATKGSIKSGKIEIYGTYTESKGHHHPGKTRYLKNGEKPQLYLEYVERYNKDGEYHGISEEHTNPTAMKRENYESSIITTREYNNGEHVETLVDYGDGKGLSTRNYARFTPAEEARANEIQFSKSAKGITVLDFDDTLATTKSNVLYTAPDGTTGKLNAEEFAKQGGELLAQGYKFDFSEFNKVVDGKTAPLFNKAMKLYGKFGAEDMFILTARAPESAKAIKQFLDAQGLKIPLRNITGLGKSEASAKANWIAEKVGEGYNDFYFADDAIQNVKAVKDMLNQFDVKGKVQQARLKFSKSGPKKMSDIIDESELDLNKILEETKGVGKDKTFSAAKARQRGKGKGRFKFFVPPSADDFAGLMYSFMGKGKQGDKHHAWFKENLFDPFSKGMRRHKIMQQQVASDIKSLRKAIPEVRKKLNKKVPGTEYTYEDAIRIYNWTQAGLDIPGLSKADQTALVNSVESDAQLQAFAKGVNSISETTDGIVNPGDHWTGGNIALDLKEALDASRSTHLQQWIENKNVIFNEANMNKIEAVYGPNFREALEDSLWRMENGGTRSKGGGRIVNNFTNWIHGSIGTTMFLNARSAMLQMISNVNFVNWSDNNMLKAAGAFANQPQYWKDVSMIFNSPFLKQRRSGIQTDVNAAELLAQVKDSKNKLKAATAYLLQLGFTPTQIADSFAIATGGATMYRNRIKTYLKEGLTSAEAETKAFEDMMEIAEETQQSTREDKISQQQASPLGKFILAFQNTPMQYNRLIKKAAQDLVNGRGDPKANISRIVYYGGIQNMIFYGLQQALFAALFSDDEEDEITDTKKERVVNGMIDTILRGSGIAGVAVATLKNVVLKFMKESEKMDDGKFYSNPDWGNVVIEGLNISPPIGIKARKIYSGLKTWEYNKDVIDHMNKTDIDNPIYDAVASVTEAVTNVPLSRMYNKVQNISESLDAEHETWKRVAMLLGWSKWSFGVKNQDVVAAKGEVKVIKAEEAKVKAEMKKVAKEVERQAANEVIEEDNLLDQEEEREEGQKDIKCAAVSRSGKRCGKKIKDGGNYCTIHESVPQRAGGEKTQCTHVKDDKARCKMKTSNSSGKCYYHD